MSYSELPPEKERGAWLRITLVLIGLTVLLLGASYVGYVYGSSTGETAITAPVPATPEVMISEREVTREVVVVITTTPQATAVEMVVPGDVPVAVETPVGGIPTLGERPTVSSPDFTTYNEVWDIVTDEFDGELPEVQQRLYGAISGSLSALDDPYTRYLPPEMAQRMRDDLDGNVSGIGAFVRETADGNVEIVRPMDGQPAELAGIKAGDIIIGIDGVSVLDKSFDEVLLLVRGPEGTSVVLTVVREGEDQPLDIEVVRAQFEVPVVESRLLPAGDQQVAYVKLSSFTHTAESGVLEALKPMLDDNPAGIILDLRDNGGGFLDQAVGVADIFLPQSTILLERNDNGLNETFSAEDGDIGEALPLVVLVNAGSASASEIVAGAVQDNGRGLLVGETTFGKGSVQQVHTLADGSELRVTIAKWYTPDNKSISDNGIEPDIEVPTPADLGGEDDTQLQTAVETVLGQ